MTVDRSTFGRGRMVRGWAVLVSGDVAAKLLGLVTFAVIARQLSLDEVGTYSFAIAYGAFFLFFTDLGIDAVVTRELAARGADQEGRILGAALVVKSLLVVVTLVVSLATIVAFDRDLRVAGAVSCAGLLVGVPGAFALVLNARIRVVGVTVIQIVAAAATLVIVVVALAAGVGPVGLVVITTATTLPAGVAIALLGWSALRHRLEFDAATVRRYAIAAVPIGVSMLGAVIYKRIDQVLLGGYDQVRELARYAAAVRLVDALNMIPVAVATMALPAFAHFIGAGDARRAERLMEQSFRFLAIVFLPGAAAVSVVAGPVLGLVYGPAFESGGTALTILVAAQFFGATGMLAAQAVIARGQSRYLAAFAVLAACVNVGIDLWAIPRHGAIGAAWASLVAYGIPLVVGLFVDPVRDVYRCWVRASIRPFVAATLVLACALVVHPSLAIAIPLFALIIPPALLVTGSTDLAELRGVWRSAFDRSPGVAAGVAGS